MFRRAMKRQLLSASQYPHGRAVYLLIFGYRPVSRSFGPGHNVHMLRTQKGVTFEIPVSSTKHSYVVPNDCISASSKLIIRV